jgi:phospholipid/cholesterol/gamma-HCH transport system substrate-binding protein
MTTQFKVGVFTLATLIAVFVVWAVLGNFSLRRNAYQIGVHFRNVAGLQPGSSVELAGVTVGTVDDIRLLPDQTATVICTIGGTTTVYRGSVFTVATTLTGQSTLTITPPANLAAAVPLPRRVLPEAQQPEGVVPPTIADLVSEGQERMKELDKTLALVNSELPGMIRNFNGVATHTNQLIVHADANLNALGQRLTATVASVNTLVGQFNEIIAVNGRNVNAMTTAMRHLVVGNEPRLARLIDNLSATSDNLNKTMASIASVAGDPTLHANLLTATANLRDSSEKLKAMATDIESITGDPNVQAELRGTVRNLSDAVAKADAILGVFSAALAQPGTAATPAGGANAAPQPPPKAAPGEVSSRPRPGAVTGASGSSERFGLATAHVRLTWNNASPGPISDLNLELLPGLATHLTVGANDLGYQTTYNVLVDIRRSPQLQYSFGVLYSNLGLQTLYRPLGPFGFDLRLYDPKRPQLDLYGDLRLAQRLQLFYGERSLMGPATLRTPRFGLQYNL